MRRRTLIALAVAATACSASVDDPPPELLSQTGLYADGTHAIAAANEAFAPQYPLWTDGATKRRWIHLPYGTAIDASDPNAWKFPVGTKLWKEFGFERPVETRMLEHVAEGQWRFAAYVWDEDGEDATLAPPEGVRGAAESAPGIAYDVPSRLDCKACHEAAPSPVLGFSALQLSSDRDPLAPRSDTTSGPALPDLVARGLVRDLPLELVVDPPRAGRAGARDRAVRGWLHANCGHCHNATGPLASLELDLAVRVGEPPESDRLVASTVGHDSAFVRTPSATAERIRAGDPSASTLLHRAASREPLTQMPPLGTRRTDPVALSLLADWIREDLVTPQQDAKDRT